MRFTKLPLAAALTLLGLAATRPSQAQTSESMPSGYSYHFDDDYMVGDTLSTTPPLLRVRGKLPRVTLIRPRASFVAEMLKSVELM